MSKSSEYQLKHSQHFLTDKRLVQSLVDQAMIAGSDTVLEIGPGRGIITRILAERADHVIAIEKDERLAANLLAGSLPPNVTLYHADALQFPLPATPYRVFANIPFRYTSAIVSKLTTGVAPPADMRLVMQKEAADRYLVGSTTTLFAHLLYPYFETEVVHHFRRRDFSPAPGVDSVLLRIASRISPILDPQLADRHRQFLTVAIGAWQASLGEAIRSVLPRLAGEHIVSDPLVRSARHLKISQVEPQIWIRIFNELIDRDDERVWKEVGRKYQRITSSRQSMERPTRTNKRADRPIR